MIRFIKAVAIALVFFSCLSVHAQTAEEFKKKGNEYFEKGDYDKAIIAYNNAIKANPQYELAYFNLASTYYKQGALDKAIKYYSKTIELNPGNTDAYYNRGSCYFDKPVPDPAKAIADFSKVINVDPKKEAAYLKRGLAYITLQNDDAYHKAIDDFNAAIAINPSNGQSWFGKGMAEFVLKDMPKAIEYLSKAIELDPGMGEAYTFRAGAYTTLKKNESAMADFITLTKLNPKDPVPVEAIADTYMEGGNSMAACMQWKKAKELGSASASDKIKTFCEGK